MCPGFAANITPDSAFKALAVNPHIVATSSSVSSSLGQRNDVKTNAQDSEGTELPAPYSRNLDIKCGNKAIKE